MIFNELFKLWQKSDLLTQAVNDTNEMLNISYAMFNNVTEMLFQDKFDNKLKEGIKKDDYLLNHFQKSIRKKVFEHMTVNEKSDQNLYTSTLLITIVSDVERLGDYCKNISEVAEIKEYLKDNVLNEIVKNNIETLKQMYKATLHAFKQTDSLKADEIMDLHYKLKKSIDKKLMELATKKIENNENFVIYALLFRYLKRISAHLRNTASSMTNSIDEIGFYSGKDN